MATSVRKRSDPRSEATRIALIEAAETLFAEHGFEAVSLRQIGTAIGSGNTRVVAYHFGTKEDFIQAIFRHRLPALEVRRRELLDELEASGAPDDLTTLSRIMCQPLLEQKNAQGQHSYGRFLCAMVQENQGPSLMMDAPFPVTLGLWWRIRALLPVDGPALIVRLHLVVAMLLDAFRLIDRLQGQQIGAFSEEAIFDDALTMAIAAIRARPD